MQTVDYVVRDTAGRLFRGSLEPQSEALILRVADYSAVSLNLARDGVETYARVGDNLVIKLENGREIILEDMFIANAQGTQLYFSSGGEIYEMSFTEAWGRTNYANYNEAEATSGLVFGDGPPVSSTLTGLETSPGYSVATSTSTSLDTMPLFLDATPVVAAGVAGVGLAGLAGLAGSTGTAAAAAVPGVVASTVVPAIIPPVVLASNGGIDIKSAGAGVDGVINAEEMAAGVIVKGETYPNSDVTVILAGVEKTTTSDADGNYEALFPGSELDITDVATQVVSASVVNPDGNTETAETQPDGNTETAETQIEFDPVTQVTIAASTIEGDGQIVMTETRDGIVVTGTAEPGSNVVVTFAGTDLNRTATAGADGSYSVIFDGSVLDGINDQQVDVTATSTDPAGNVAAVTEQVRVDTVLNIAFDAVQAEDNVINRVEGQSEVVLTGTTDIGASVSIVMNGVTVSATVNDDGIWTANFPPSGLPDADAELTLTAYATDASGNTATAEHVVFVDHLGDVTINPSPLEIDDIVNATEAADGVVVTGTTTPGSTVLVNFHTFSGYATVAADGTWSVNVPGSNIDAGSYDVTITATANTPSGNTSTDTETVRIDTEVLNLALDGNVVSGDNFINTTEQAGGVAVSGTVEPGSTVLVTLGTATKEAQVDAAGNWTLTFVPSDIPAGDYQTVLSAVATDEAGNTHTINQTVQVDTVASNLSISAVPIAGDGVVNGPEAQDGFEVTGTAEPGSLVTVALGAVQYTVTASPDGSYTAYFGPDDIGTGEMTLDLNVTTTDDAGNVTTDSRPVHIDTAVSGVNLLATTIGGDGVLNAEEIGAGVAISGQGEPGATVVIAVGNQDYTGVVAADGTFTVLVPTSAFPTGSTNLEITATFSDIAGNVDVTVLNVQVDTELTGYSVTTDPMAGQTVLNSIVAQAGIVIGGTVEVGATVSVNFDGTTKLVTAGADGTWSVVFAGDEVPFADNETFVMEITATDTAGNTITDRSVTVTLDTSIPAAPEISQVGTVTGEATGSINFQADEGNYQIYSVSGDGASSAQVVADVYRLDRAGDQDELYFDFVNNVPAGNDLVVQLNDTAGNSTSTLFVLDEPSTSSGAAGVPTVNMGDAGYDRFNIQAVDLQNGDRAEMTITAQQLEDLSSISDNLLVRGGADDTVTALGAVKTSETRVIDGESYDIYTMGDNGAYLIVDQDVNIITS